MTATVADALKTLTTACGRGTAAPRVLRSAEALTQRVGSMPLADLPKSWAAEIWGD